MIEITAWWAKKTEDYAPYRLCEIHPAPEAAFQEEPMRKERCAGRSRRNAADQPALKIDRPHLLARTERHLTTGLFALALVTAPSENDSVRSCFKRNSRNT